MLPADSAGSASRAAGEFAGGRFRQFYDAQRLLGQGVAERMEAAGNIAWDVYLIFAPGATWTGTVPLPDKWLHQLNATWADPGRRRRGLDLVWALDAAIRRLLA